MGKLIKITNRLYVNPERIERVDWTPGGLTVRYESGETDFFSGQAAQIVASALDLPETEEG